MNTKLETDKHRQKEKKSSKTFVAQLHDARKGLTVPEESQ
jgi:hypothetical protein